MPYESVARPTRQPSVRSSLRFIGRPTSYPDGPVGGRPGGRSGVDPRAARQAAGERVFPLGVCYMYLPISMLGYPALLVRVLVMSLPLLAAGCSALMPAPTPILPAEDLYKTGETELGNRRYEEARVNFRKIVERHPNSPLAPKARFYVGEADYREAEFDKAVKGFEGFLAFFPPPANAGLAAAPLG